MSKTTGQAAPFKGTLKRSLLTCGGTLALVTACAFIGPAMAQNTPAASNAADSQTVVVRGIRKGIQDAITAKRKSSQIVEAVSAEDIGKLPDNSIAESIARLPGIAAQRTNGRAQSLSIRGLGPDYTVTTLNGREQVSTGDNRSVEFDQYPSELISQVLVYKTPNAGMVNQGIAGTADLQTVRPLAFGKRTVAVNVRKEMNSEKAAIAGLTNNGARYSITYIDQFLDKKVGLALGYAHTKSPYQVTKLEPWGDGDIPTCGGSCLPADANKFVPGGQKNAVQSSTLDRDGFMGVLEFKPYDNVHLTLDAYHSEFDETQKIARLEYPLLWSSSQLQPGYTASASFIDHGVFTNVKTVVENYANQRKATVDSVGLNGTWDVNDQWSLMADVSHQKVDRTDLILESTAGTGPSGSGATDTITFDRTDHLNAYTLSGVIDYSDFNKVFLTDPGGWGGPIANRAGYVKNPHIEDEMNIVRAAATRKLDGLFISNVTVGLSHTDHTKKKDGVEGFIGLKTAAAVAVPTQYRLGTTDASFLGNTSGMISYDSLAMWNDGFFNFQQATGQDEIKRTWSVDEKVDVAFIKADIDTHMFGVPVTGNIGIQSQTADQRANSFYTDGTPTGIKPQTGGAKYTDVLPSLSLNFEVAEDMKVRFGAGTTIVRPRMDDMSAGTGYGVKLDTDAPVTFNGQRVYWQGGGGNAQLKPWKANAYDLSIEKYFGRKGYVSAAIFYKDLTRFIFNDTVFKDYTGAALTSNCYDDANRTVKHMVGGNWVCAGADANRIGTSSVQQNGSGGSIQGVELSASLPGELVWSKLDGFGVILTGAWNRSAINPKGTGNVPVPGLSKEIFNTTVYYEKHGFSARISNRHRADFVGEVPNYTNALDNRNVAEESVVDAQLSYEIQSGPAKGLTLSLSGSNLTNEPFLLYKGNNVVREEKYGSTYLAGVSYRW